MQTFLRKAGGNVSERSPDGRKRLRLRALIDESPEPQRTALIFLVRSIGATAWPKLDAMESFLEKKMRMGPTTINNLLAKVGSYERIRTRTVLEGLGITSIEDLTSMTDAECRELLKGVKYNGGRAYYNVLTAMENLDLHFREENQGEK